MDLYEAQNVMLEKNEKNEKDGVDIQYFVDRICSCDQTDTCDHYFVDIVRPSSVSFDAFRPNGWTIKDYYSERSNLFGMMVREKPGKQERSGSGKVIFDRSKFERKRW